MASRRRCKPLDLTHVQFVLLACTWWLNEQGEHPNQLALARFAGTDVKMVSQVLRALEHKGLIEREVDSADTRAKKLRVTRAGAQLAPRAVVAVEAVDTEFFRPVHHGEVMRMLRRLADPPDAAAGAPRPPRRPRKRVQAA